MRNQIVRDTGKAVITKQSVSVTFQPGANLTNQKSHRRQLRWQIIPSLREWEEASATSRFRLLDRRSSPEMSAIDQAVAGYDRLAVIANTPVVPLWEAAVTLFEAIEVYLATGRGHKQKRVSAVNDLRAVTMVTLSDLRWRKLKEVTGGYKPGMRPMVQHVWPEMHAPNHDRVGHDANDAKQPDLWLDPNSQSQEKYLFQHLRKVRAENSAAIDEVKYVEDSDRWKYQVVFSPQGLAYERLSAEQGKVLNQERAITTNGDLLSTAIYVVDENGVFFTETSQHQGATLNHCSYLRGKPVMCAGQLGITNGVVGYIDNGSGHYRPTLKNLLNAIRALKDQVSPLSFGAILVTNQAGPYRMAVYTAAKFLNTSGRCLPVGYYEYNGRGTHYRHDLKEFQNNDDLRAYMEAQDNKAARAKIQDDLKKVMTRLESTGQKSGKLTLDSDRQVFQAALQTGLVVPSTIDVYIKNDEPMQLWLKRQTYGVKIPVPQSRLG
jgi:hypothetical protein